MIQPEGIEPEEQHIIDLLREYDAALASERNDHDGRNGGGPTITDGGLLGDQVRR